MADEGKWDGDGGLTPDSELPFSMLLWRLAVAEATRRYNDGDPEAMRLLGLIGDD